MRINLKSKYAFGTASYLYHIRSSGKKKKKKILTASSSLACQAGSGEIMQYLHDGNLISSSQTDPNHVLLITSPGVGGGGSRAGMQSEGRRSHDVVQGLFGQSCRYTARSDLGTCAARGFLHLPLTCIMSYLNSKSRLQVWIRRPCTESNHNRLLSHSTHVVCSGRYTLVKQFTQREVLLVEVSTGSGQFYSPIAL